ncbi:GIY-YIG nuclease family protein [Flavobacterium sp.]|uniref:GIY-YIG nuclease family protein n=1 Tax=Flavobacterium sp. TaxID=239 RepID=UPI002FDCE574
MRQKLIYIPYTVYILHSHTEDKFYIGCTTNLSERIIRHNQKSKGFTGSTNDWILVYQEEFNSQSEAIQREKQIKNWKSKIKIKELIQQNNY